MLLVSCLLYSLLFRVLLAHDIPAQCPEKGQRAKIHNVLQHLAHVRTHLEPELLLLGPSGVSTMGAYNPSFTLHSHLVAMAASSGLTLLTEPASLQLCFFGTLEQCLQHVDNETKTSNRSGSLSAI